MKYVFFLLIFSPVCMAANGQSSFDKEAVEKIIMRFQEDFNDGRFLQAPHYTTDDWEHINPLGGIDIGRENVLAVVRAVHQTFLQGVTMTTEEMTVRFITPNVAIADAIHRFSVYITPDGVRHENERQIKTYVVVKQKGKWLLTSDQATIILLPGVTLQANTNL